MTLDFKKLIRNAVKKQMAIQHFGCNVQIFKKEELPERVAARIRELKGETFLEDANYTLWFSGNNITKETVEKTVFKIANKAMAESANDMNEKDLVLLDLGDGAAEPEPAADEAGGSEDADGALSDQEADDANAEAAGALFGSGEEDDDADEADDLDESVEEPAPGERFCFIKITMK